MLVHFFTIRRRAPSETNHKSLRICARFRLNLLASRPGLVKGSIRDQVLHPALRQLLTSSHARLFKGFLDRDQLVALVWRPPEHDFAASVDYSRKTRGPSAYVAPTTVHYVHR